MLSYEERCALESLTVAGDVVVNAAFNVGLESRDMDYMAALFTDLAALRLDNSQVIHRILHIRELSFNFGIYVIFQTEELCHTRH